MRYEPIKKHLGKLVYWFPLLYRLLYWMLDLLFLRAWYIHREVRRLPQKDPTEKPFRVLDAGAGFGQHAYFVARQFPNARVHAVDIKQEYVNWGRSFTKGTSVGPKITWAVDDLRDLHAEGPFDLILAVDVLEHISEDAAVLRQFDRVLAPNGHIVIHSPSDQGGSGVRMNEDEGFIDEHVRPGYNLGNLEAKLRSANLNPIRSIYTYGPYGAAAWRWLIKYSMQMLEVTWWFLLVLPFYFLLVVPFGLLLHVKDVVHENATGTGLLVVGQKLPVPVFESQSPPLNHPSEVAIKRKQPFGPASETLSSPQPTRE